MQRKTVNLGPILNAVPLLPDLALDLTYLENPELRFPYGKFCIFEDGKVISFVDHFTTNFKRFDKFWAKVGEPVYIGSYEEVPYFAQEVKSGTAAQNDLELHSLRAVAEVDEVLFAIQSRGVQLLNWRKNHKFCGICGGKTASSDTEHAIRCSDCEKSFYPKIMPCVMALVTRGDQCLLARHAGRGKGTYTALVGFIEAGESAEHAIYREVLEEVGIKTGKQRYFASQAWPFPGQLMLAYFVEYESGDIVPEEGEIADAQWFTAEQVAELENVPAPYTISGKLIRAFAADKGNTK